MGEYTTVISSIVAGLFGGGLVALVNYLKFRAEASTRDAQVEKLQAEAEQIRAETDRVRASMEVVESEQVKAGKDIEFQAKEIDWLKLVITLIVSDYERMHLKNLAADEHFVAEVKEGSTFESELRHLLTLNLIERLPGKGMRSLVGRGKVDIKESLVITEQGRRYLKMVEELNTS